MTQAICPCKLRDDGFEPFAPSTKPFDSTMLPSLEKHKLFRFEFSVHELDEIVDGLLDDPMEVDPDGGYLISFWNYFDWWLRVSEELGDGLVPQSGHGVTNPAFERYKARLRELEVDVLKSFPDAHLAEPGFHDHRLLPQLELLKRYRLFTRFLSRTAKQLWPNESLRWLTHHS